jgi:hypothetical protein
MVLDLAAVGSLLGGGSAAIGAISNLFGGGPQQTITDPSKLYSQLAQASIAQTPLNLAASLYGNLGGVYAGALGTGTSIAATAQNAFLAAALNQRNTQTALNAGVAGSIADQYLKNVGSSNLANIASSFNIPNTFGDLTKCKVADTFNKVSLAQQGITGMYAKAADAISNMGFSKQSAINNAYGLTADAQAKMSLIDTQTKAQAALNKQQQDFFLANRRDARGAALTNAFA